MTRAWLLSLPVLPFLVSCLAIEADFSFYPENARPCLYEASDTAECTGDTAEELNSCLCSDETGFITDSAHCLGRDDVTDVGAVFKTMDEACGQTKTPLVFSEETFKQEAERAAASQAAASASSSSTSTHAPRKTATTTSRTTSSHSSTKAAASTGHSDGGDNHGKGGGLSAGAVAGAAVGAAAAAISAMGVLLFFLRRRWQQSGVQGQPHEAEGEGYPHEISTSTYAPVDQFSEGGYYETEQRREWGGGSSSRLSSYKPGSSFIPEPTVLSVTSSGLGVEYGPYGSPGPQQQQHDEQGLVELESDGPSGQVHEMGPGR